MSIDLNPKEPSPYWRRALKAAPAGALALTLAACGEQVATTSSPEQPANPEPSATAPATPGTETSTTETVAGNETGSDTLAPLEIASLNPDGTTTGYSLRPIEFGERLTDDDLAPYGELVRQWVDGDIESDDAYVERLREMLAVPADELSTPEDQARAVTDRVAKLMNAFPATEEQIDNACRVFGSETMGNYGTDDTTQCILARMPLDMKFDSARNGFQAMNIEIMDGNPFKGDYVIGSDPNDETEAKQELIANVAVTRVQSNIISALETDNRLAVDPSVWKGGVYSFDDPIATKVPLDDPDAMPGVQFKLTVGLSDKPGVTETAVYTVNGWEELGEGSGVFLPTSVEIEEQP